MITFPQSGQTPSYIFTEFSIILFTSFGYYYIALCVYICCYLYGCACAGTEPKRYAAVVGADHDDTPHWSAIASAIPW